MYIPSPAEQIMEPGRPDAATVRFPLVSENQQSSVFGSCPLFVRRKESFSSRSTVSYSGGTMTFPVCMLMIPWLWRETSIEKNSSYRFFSGISE